ELANNPYALLFHLLARAHAGEAPGSEFDAEAAMLKSKAWPHAAIELFAGKRTPAATLSAASNSDEVWEAHTYIGEWYLARGDKAMARKSLQRAADTCPKHLREYLIATSELKMLGQ